MPTHLPRTILQGSLEPVVRRAIAIVEKSRQLWTAVPGNWGVRGNLKPEQVDQIETLLEDASEMFGSSLSPARAIALRIRIQEVSELCDRAMSLFRTLANTLDLTLVATAESVGRFVDIVDSLSTVDDAALALRSAALSSPEAPQVLEELSHRAEELRKQVGAFDQKYARSVRPGVDELRQHVWAMATAPRFLPSLFSRGYRNARAAYRVMTAQAVDRPEMETGFRQLVEHTTEVTEFENANRLGQFFGAAASGLRSPFGKAKELLRWRSRVMKLCRGLEDDGRILEGALWTGRSEGWREAEARLRDSNAVGACTGLKSALSGIQGALANREVLNLAMPLPTILQLLSAATAVLDNVIAAFNSAGAETARTSVEELRHRVRLVQDAWGADADLEQYRSALKTLGVSLDGGSTDLSPLLHALRFLTVLNAAGLPGMT